MKRKFTALVALLLALCTLLCSCATAGIGTPAVFGAIGDSLRGFFNSSKDVLADHVRLIEEGEACFAIVCSVNDITVETALAELQNTLLEKTGVALPRASTLPEGKKALRVELVGKKSAATEGINDSIYHIYYEDDTLYIKASNTVMLTEGIRQLTKLFEEDTSAAKGYLSIAKALDLTAPTNPLTDSAGNLQYVIVRPEKAGSRISDAVSKLANTIKDVSGIQVKIKDDERIGSSESTIREIVVGACRRDGVAELTAELDETTFAITTTERGIMIAAKNDFMIEQAVDTFIATFLKGVAPAAEKNAVSLPAALNIRAQSQMAILASGGVSSYALVYPDTINTLGLSAVKSFATELHRLTGASLTMVSEGTMAGASACEIRLGALRGAPVSAETTWSIRFSDDALEVHASTGVALWLALRALTEKLTEWVMAQNSFSYEDGNLIFEDGAPRLLAVPRSFTLSGDAVPEPEHVTGLKELTEGSYLLYRNDSSKADATAYTALLTANGYDMTTSRTVGDGGLYTATLCGEQVILNISYSEADQTLHVVSDPISSTALPPASASNEPVICEPLFLQVGGLYGTVDYGMCYIIRLTNGKFIVIDGGGRDDNVSRHILYFLQSYTPKGMEPTIAAWIFTTGHWYHTGAFVRLSFMTRAHINLESVCYNFPTSAETSAMRMNWYTNYYQENIRGYADYFNSYTTFYRTRTGQVYHFPGCEVEILFSLEDHTQPLALDNIKDASTVLRLTLHDGETTRTVLISGDASVNVQQRLYTRYGSYLASDAMQIANHGSGVHTEFYTAVSPATLFWPCAVYTSKGTPHFADLNWCGFLRKHVLGADYAKVVYVAGLGDVILNIADLGADTPKEGSLGLPATQDALPPASEPEPDPESSS